MTLPNIINNTSIEWMESAICHGQMHLFFAKVAERPEARVRREAKAASLCSACLSLLNVGSMADRTMSMVFGAEKTKSNATMLALSLLLELAFATGTGSSLATRAQHLSHQRNFIGLSLNNGVSERHNVVVIR